MATMLGENGEYNDCFGFLTHSRILLRHPVSYKPGWHLQRGLHITHPHKSLLRQPYTRKRARSLGHESGPTQEIGSQNLRQQRTNQILRKKPLERRPPMERPADPQRVPDSHRTRQI